MKIYEHIEFIFTPTLFTLHDSPKTVPTLSPKNSHIFGEIAMAVSPGLRSRGPCSGSWFPRLCLARSLAFLGMKITSKKKEKLGVTWDNYVRVMGKLL